MKTVTLYPLAANRFRQRIEACHGRHQGVKRGIKTGHLQRSGKVFRGIRDGLQRLRKMLWSIGHQLFKRGNQFRRNHLRAGVLWAAMHHAVADGIRLVFLTLRHNPGEEISTCSIMIRQGNAFTGKRTSLPVPYRKSPALMADARERTGKQKLFVLTGIVQRKLDAR